MTETTFIRKKMSFKCRDCELSAKIVLVDERRIDRVYCQVCGTEVRAEEADLMYRELASNHRVQVSRNLIRETLQENRMGRLPLVHIDNEISDSRWPFILVIEDDDPSATSN